MMIEGAGAGMSVEAAVRKAADNVIFNHEAPGLRLEIATLGTGSSPGFRVFRFVAGARM